MTQSRPSITDSVVPPIHELERAMNAESEDKLDLGAATPEYVVGPAEPVTGIISLIRELWRRNVFKIGLAYFIAASLFGWVPVLALGGFDPPDWLWITIAILLFAGFPVALYFTWIMQPNDREIRQIVLGSFSGLVMSVGLLAVVGGVKAIAAQPSGDVTIYIFAGFVLLAIGVPLTLFGYGGLMKQLRRFKAERPARADSHNTERKWVLGTAARLNGIKVALGLFAIALVGATLIFSTGTLRNMKPTTLIGAVQIGDTEMVKALIDAGADVDARFETYGWTALVNAATELNVNVAKVLIEAGADINAHMDGADAALPGITALIRAANYEGSEEFVRLLIDVGADVNAKSNDGGTALMRAANLAPVAVTAALIDAGADVNVQAKSGWSALMRAARYGRTETVGVLIRAGADVHAKSNDGETALMLASQYDHTGVVDILKQSGAK